MSGEADDEETGGGIDALRPGGYARAMVTERTPAAARSNRRGQVSKTHILDCAIDLLGAQGYGGLSISAVCKAADVAPTSIYWHFGDKAGLMAAMVKHSLRRDFDHFLVAFDAERASLPLIDAYIRVLRDQIVSDRPSSWAVISTLAEGRREAPEIAALINEARRKQVEFAHEWGEVVAKAGKPEVFADLVVGLNTFAANVWQQGRDAEEVDRILASLREMMVLVAGSMMTCMVEDDDFRRCMAAWGYEPRPSR